MLEGFQCLLFPVAGDPALLQGTDFVLFLHSGVQPLWIAPPQPCLYPLVLLEHLKLILTGWQWVQWALVGAVDSCGCRGLRWSPEQWKIIHGFVVVQVIFCIFLQGLGILGSVEGSVSSSLSGIPWGSPQTTSLGVEGVWVAKPCCLHVTFGKCHSLNHLRQNQLN